LDRLINLAQKFAASGKVTAVSAFGSGNINDTFLVTVLDGNEPHFVLQRLNTHVFKQPRLVMQNMRIFTQHICDKLQCEVQQPEERWAVPRVLLTKNSQDHWVEPDGTYWRAISFIDGSKSIDIIQDLNHGREVGYALGRFHDLISDLDPDRLADTLVGFHITPQYLQYYDEVLLTHTIAVDNSLCAEAKATSAVGVKPAVGTAEATPTTTYRQGRGSANSTSAPTERLSQRIDYCLKFVEHRQEWAKVLEKAKDAGKLPLRPIHGDPKVNNVMICNTTQQAIGMIDLDTVKPGLVHYDIGDCLRSGCNSLGEETKDWEQVQFDTQMCRAILAGYLPQAKGFLKEDDYEYLFDGIRLLAFELGLRFFTDYLAGNVYFNKVKYPTHNLDRALVQFKLTESIEAQETVIRQMIEDLR
jgi:Phosphotransferase enzyme family